MSTILNKNTDGTRTVPLGERELAQELTPNDKDYGKVRVGTDGTLEGEVLLAKDEDVSNLGVSSFVSSGVINKQDNALIFNEVVGNEYNMATADRFVNFDGKVIDTYGPEMVTNGDFSNGTTGWVATSGGSIEPLGESIRLYNDSTDQLIGLERTTGEVFTDGVSLLVSISIKESVGSDEIRVYSVGIV